MKIVRLSLFGALLFCLPTFAQDSPMFRGNLAHTGVYNAPGIPKFSRIKWKFQTGGQVIASPAVTNGTAYIASTDGNLYAVDLESGAIQERRKFSQFTTGAVAVSRDESTIFYSGPESGIRS